MRAQDVNIYGVWPRCQVVDGLRVLKLPTGIVGVNKSLGRAIHIHARIAAHGTAGREPGELGSRKVDGDSDSGSRFGGIAEAAAVSVRQRQRGPVFVNDGRR